MRWGSAGREWASLAGSLRANQIALVTLTGMGSAFLGGVAAGLLGGVLQSRALFQALSIPCALVAAQLAGRWMARREAPPTRMELVAGSVLYGGICILTGLGTGQPAPVIFGLLWAGVVGVALRRGAKWAGAR